MGVNENGNFGDRLRNLSDEQRMLLERRLLEKRAAAAGRNTIPKRPVESPSPLSYSQELLWLINQLDETGIAYNTPNAFRLRGALDVDALRRALTEVVQRHEVLRTTYDLVDGQPMQFISPHASVDLTEVDLQSVGAEEREAELQRILKRGAERPFDLRLGPIARATIIRLAPEEHVLLTVEHHIAVDGWSKDIFFRELASLYDAFSQGIDPQLPPVALQYADYAVWHRAWLESGVLDEQVRYWRRQLQGAPPNLELPRDRPRPPIQTYVGDREAMLLDPSILEEARRVSTANGSTMFMTLLAAFATLLHRYSGQDDIVIGTPFLSRNRGELEKVVGYFTNTVALRIDLAGDPTFAELLARVREVTLGAFANGDVPFERVIREVQPERDLSQSPVFQVMMVLQNPDSSAARGAAFSPAGVTVEPVEHGKSWSKFDLTVGMRERQQGLNTGWEYSTELFEPETISRMMKHFETLLGGLTANPDRPISRLPILSDEERRRVLVDWNGTEVVRDRRCLHELIEEQARRTPDAAAVECERQTLTYRQLDARANQLARHLLRLGVTPDQPVGLAVDGSEALVIGLLAILKAGGACLPLDPAYPQERLAFMLADSAAAVVIAARSQVDCLPPSAAQVVCLEDLDESLAQESELPPDVRVDDRNLAYVIYTSGSTGQPRGVLLEHRGLVNHALAAVDLYGLRPDDRVLQFASISFDICIEEIFPSLIAGATVVLMTSGTPIVGPPFLEWIRAARLTVLDLPTAFWHSWMSELERLQEQVPSSLRLVIVGGEKASASAYRSWLDLGGRAVRWMNTYGPTEASVVASAYEPGGSDVPADIPIGSPLANAKLYVLDGSAQPVPIGVPGELYIGGVGVARGYQNRPELDEERFLPDAFGGEDAGARMYRTGDVVRWLPDGNLAFVGRTDDQVKIRGFRIEPGEVQLTLEKHPSVRAAIVIAREDVEGDRRLVAYVRPKDPAREPSSSDLRGFLSEQLPAYMVPTVFVVVAVFPLTPNGKLDIAALPAPASTRSDLDGVFVPPRTEREGIVAGIWGEVLSVEPIGAHDDFFALGGHSLLAMQMISRLQKTFAVDLTLRTIFEAPTVAALARAVDVALEGGARAEAGPKLVARDRRRHFANVSQTTPPSPIARDGRKRS